MSKARNKGKKTTPIAKVHNPTIRGVSGTKPGKVQESGVAYMVKGNVHKEHFDAFRWLGKKLQVNSGFDYITQGEKGITTSSIDELAGYLGVTRKTIAEDILDISVKTLERKKSSERLNKKISSHAIEIAKLMEHAYEVFGTDDKVRLWVNAPNKALNGSKPVELMDTLTGLVMIGDVLGRIQEGVFS